MRENTDQKKLRVWTLFTQCYRFRQNSKCVRISTKFETNKPETTSKTKHLLINGRVVPDSTLLTYPWGNSKHKVLPPFYHRD